MFVGLKIKYKINKGFTLIELLVVIAIIGILSSVILGSLNSARVRSIDVRRKADLVQIRMALELYYSNCGTYVVAQNCTGTTYGSGGIGWFNADYGNGPVSKGLVDNGVIGQEIVDISGARTGNTAHMIWVDQNHYTLWATIANPSTSDNASLSSCYFSGYDNYGGAPSHNYCISN